MQKLNEFKIADWLYLSKKKIIIGILSALILSIIITMIFIAVTLRSRLVSDSKQKTDELSGVIKLSLSNLMLARDPGDIQSTLVAMARSESSIVKAFILDRHGRVAYSSKKEEIGTLIDRFSDTSCKGCHTGPVATPHDTTMVMTAGNEQVLRNVSIIYNEISCHSCHPPSDRINGKLIIDRSIKSTDELIKTVELSIVIPGIVCLVFLVPFLSRLMSRGVDQYIHEIFLKSTELTLLYGIVERLSKTIEIEELKPIIIEIISEAFSADEIEIILPKEGKEHGGVHWVRGVNRIERRNSGETDPLRTIIDEWLEEKLSEERISDDRQEVYMPISKGSARYGLIVMRKTGNAFDPQRLVLVRAMASHISVAFENAALYHLAITDELTGLYSKRHFRFSMEKKFSLFEDFGEKLTLLMIDIDNFKVINDTYGHPAGDGILRDISQCLQVATRDGDTAFRYGGEEFAVILPATDPAGGRLVAERMRKQIERQAFKIAGQVHKVTVSIGAATCPMNALTIKDLILESDKALYEAKRAGKNRVVMSSAVSGA